VALAVTYPVTRIPVIRMKRAPLTAAALERRKPVWDAMSDVFLDTETRWAMPRIAFTLVQSGYEPEELDAIWRDEIVPECSWNLNQVAGEWAMFVLDEDALAPPAPGQKPLVERLWRGGVSTPSFIDGQWRAILDLRATLLALPPAQRAERTAMWTVFVHAYLEASLEKVLFLEKDLDALRATGASEEALVAAFQEVRPILRSLLLDDELPDEERRARDVRVAIGLAAQGVAL
jgi:hypothetical protein